MRSYWLGPNNILISTLLFSLPAKLRSCTAASDATFTTYAVLQMLGMFFPLDAICRSREHPLYADALGIGLGAECHVETLALAQSV